MMIAAHIDSRPETGLFEMAADIRDCAERIAGHVPAAPHNHDHGCRP